MPNRIIRDGILTSERVDLLGALEEVFYRRLMSVVDDYGRYYGNHSLIRAACYPLKLDKVSDSDIGKWLQVTEKAGLVRQYLATDGKRYIQLVDFGQRIQSKSKFPEPPSDLELHDECGHPSETSGNEINSGSPKSTVVHREQRKPTVVHRLVGDGVEDEGVGAKPRESSRRKPVKTSLPVDFSVSAAVKAWAEQKGYTRLDEHLEAFVGKATANGYTYVDWDAALRNAIRDDWAKLGKSPSSTVNNSGSSVAAQRPL